MASPLPILDSTLKDLRGKEQEFSGPLRVTEIYSSIQCEGPRTGYPSLFIRFSGCNLRCVFPTENGRLSYCDTPHSLTLDSGDRISEDSLLDKIKQGPSNIVFTGGEPMLYHKNLCRILLQLIFNLVYSNRYTFEIETNSTIAPNILAEGISCKDLLSNLCYSKTLQVNFSPKLGISYREYTRQDFEWGLGNCVFKFPVGKESDVTRALKFCEELELPRENIWIMPVGEIAQHMRDSADWIVSMALKYDLKVSNRVHILLWDNKKGV